MTTNLLVDPSTLPLSPSISRYSVPDPLGFATCPRCHAVDATVTNAAVAQGVGWRCARCSQSWDGQRLAVVAAYDEWAASRA